MTGDRARESYWPEPAPPSIDLGHGVWMRFVGAYAEAGHPVGLVESHPRPDGEGRCNGSIFWEGAADGRDTWTLHSLDPLHVEPSLLCRRCGHHGFIREGKWVPA